MDLSHRAESGAAAAALGSGHSPWGRGPCGMGQLCPTEGREESTPGGRKYGSEHGE